MPSEFRVPIDLAGELVFFRSKNQKLAIGHWPLAIYILIFKFTRSPLSSPKIPKLIARF